MPPPILLAESLLPAALDFACPEDGFSLRDELQRLDRVRHADAPEAVVLYGCRILEVMSRRLVGPREPGKDRLACYIDLLCNKRLLTNTLKRWLHNLRELGNQARHVRRGITGPDADAAFVITLRWLEWHFCEFEEGPRLPALLVHNRPLESLLPAEMSQLIREVDRADASNADFRALAKALEQNSLFQLTPILPAVLAEILIGRKMLDEAHGVIQSGRSRFGRDVRLRQMEGLYWSRRGEVERNPRWLHRGREILEGIAAAGTAQDEETYGIRGGTYKRLAELEPDNPAWLPRSCEVYREGWEMSQGTNTYLGVNAASTALWLGRREEAAEVAARVGAALAEEQARLRAHGAEPDYWGRVTVAEVYLLQGDLARAGAAYRAAFRDHPQNTGGIEVTKKQARRVLDKLGQAERAAEVLGE